MASADRIARDHRDDGLRQAPNLDVQVGHMEAPGHLMVTGLRGVRAGDVAAPAAADALVAAAAEGQRTLAGEDHDADLRILAGKVEGVDQLDDRLGPESVANLRAVDRDLRDRRLVSRVPVLAGRELIADVFDIGRRRARSRSLPAETTVSGMKDWLQRAAQRRPERVAIEFADGRHLNYEELRQAAYSRTAFHGSARGPRSLEGGA